MHLKQTNGRQNRYKLLGEQEEKKLKVNNICYDKPTINKLSCLICRFFCFAKAVGLDDNIQILSCCSNLSTHLSILDEFCSNTASEMHFRFHFHSKCIRSLSNAYIDCLSNVDIFVSTVEFPLIQHKNEHKVNNIHRPKTEIG